MTRKTEDQAEDLEPATTRWVVHDAKRAAKLEAKASKREQRAAKQDTKTAKQTAKAVHDDNKAAEKKDKRETKAAEKKAKRDAKAVEKGEHGRLTPGNAKKLVGVVRVLGPTAAPYARQAFGLARDGYERARARRLGIDAADAGRFTGRGAGLQARIAGDTDALHELRTRTAGRSAADSSTTEQFAEQAEARLSQLASAVRAAERMPVQRRRAAHRAVTGELDRIEDDLLNRLGI